MTKTFGGSRSALEVLVFQKGRFSGSLMFTSAEISIGRDPRAMLRLDDPSVSRNHAALHFDGICCTIEDLDSRTGLQINGRRTSGGQVEATDDIAIGPFRLRLAIHRAEEEVTPSEPVPSKPAGAAGWQADRASSPPSTGPASRRHGAPAPFAKLVRKSSIPAGRSSAPPAGALRAVAAQAIEPSSCPSQSAIALAPHPEPIAVPPPPPVSSAPVVRVPSPPARMTAQPVVALPPPPPTNTPSSGLTPPPIRPRTQTMAYASDARAMSSSQAPVASLPAAISRAQAAVPAPAMPARNVLAVESARPVGNLARPSSPTAAASLAQLVEPDEETIPSLLTGEDDEPTAFERPNRQIPLLQADDEELLRAPNSDLSEQLEEHDALKVGFPFAGSTENANKEDDEEEDDANFQPSFDLLEKLRNRAPVDPRTVKRWTVEVIQYRDNCVRNIAHIGAGGKIRVAGSRRMGRHRPHGVCSIELAACRCISILRDGREIPEHEWRQQITQPGSLRLKPGQQANLVLMRGEAVIVQLVPAADAIAHAPLQVRPTRDLLMQAGSSVGVHLAVLVIAALSMLGQPPEERALNEGRFAKINLAAIELEPAPAPPQPLKPIKSSAKAAVNEATRDTSTKATTRQNPNPSAASRDNPGAASGPPSTRKILSALGGSQGTSTSFASAMTNLDAIGGAFGSGGFKVSGVVGKMSGDGLRVAGPGSGTGRAGGADTKSVGELGGGDLGKVEAKAGGAVRARVTSAPQAVTGEGVLDRGQIQRVVNSHVHQVQGCYERQLVKNPTLAGKITFEWVIGTSGGVTTVRVRGSSLPSSEVASCIQSAIAGWRFPSPTGGSVTVTYPFGFSALSQ